MPAAETPRKAGRKKPKTRSAATGAADVRVVAFPLRDGGIGYIATDAATHRAALRAMRFDESLEYDSAVAKVTPSPLDHAVVVHRIGRGGIEAPPFKRYEDDTERLHDLLRQFKHRGIDPETFLENALHVIKARQKTVGARLGSALEAERERRRKGRKARAPSNEGHRKALRRDLEEIFPDEKMRRWIEDSYRKPSR